MYNENKSEQETTATFDTLFDQAMKAVTKRYFYAAEESIRNSDNFVGANPGARLAAAASLVQSMAYEFRTSILSINAQKIRDGLSSIDVSVDNT